MTSQNLKWGENNSFEESLVCSDKNVCQPAICLADLTYMCMYKYIFIDAYISAQYSTENIFTHN